MKNTVIQREYRLGKRFLTHECGIFASDQEKRAILQRHNHIAILRSICELSAWAASEKVELPAFKNIPIYDSVLIEAATLACEWCESGTLDTEVPDNDIETLLRFAHGELEKRSLGIDDPVAIFIQIAYSQFNFKEPQSNLLARHWYIFEKLWKSIDTTTDPKSDILAEIGLPYNFAICCTLALCSNRAGYNYQFSQDLIDEFNNRLGTSVSLSSCQIFLKWISCSRQEIIQRGNPPQLAIKPVYDSGFSPLGDGRTVYFCPSPNSAIAKITTGVYHTLSDRHKEKNSNAFKVDFGRVFEAYVGELLEYHLPTWNISPEITYLHNRSKNKSVDFLVKQEDKLILIEVKQSSIFLEAKATGLEDSIADDLSKTLTKAVEQLHRTSSFLSQKPEFSQYRACTKIEKVVVFFDPLYVANSVMKEIAKRNSVLNMREIHIINISEFESLLDAQLNTNTIHEILTFKRMNDEEMDFKEFLYKTYPSSAFTRNFIQEKFNDILPNL